MNHPRNRARGCGAFMERLREAAPLKKGGKTPHKIADPDGGPVEIGDSFEENGAGKDAAEEDEPHQGPAFLHVINHGCLEAYNGEEG